MIRQIVSVCAVVVLAAGCATVPTASKEETEVAKQFAAPSQGKAGLYIYRTSGAGQALKKDIYVDGKCIGESAPKVFFYEEVEGDREHVLATESEFSPNELKLTTASGTNYFVQQYIKMGVFVGGANLKVVDEAEGRKQVQKLSLATSGTCSK